MTTFGIRRAVMPLAAVLALIATQAQAALVVEIEPNNTVFTPQNIDAFFDLAFDANIAGSTVTPHATVSGTGDGTFDFYSFTTTGGAITLDIDFGFFVPFDPTDFDSILRLFRSDGTFVTVGDDSGLFAGVTCSPESGS